MDYQKHYDALIARSQERVTPEVTESHHIIPRCMGGSDRKSNRVNLTPEEHFVAHQLLAKMYPMNPGLIVAATLMACDNRNGKRSNNKLYGWLRKRASEAVSASRTGIPLSEDTKRKISNVLKSSDAMLAAARSRVGVPRSAETKAKISEAHKASEKAGAARKEMIARKVGVPRHAETKAKLSAAHTGRTMPHEVRAKISKANTGREISIEARENLSKALMGNQNSKGARRSAETRAKMSASSKGRKYSPETIRRMVENKTPEQRRAAALRAWETKRAKAALSQN